MFRMIPHAWGVVVILLAAARLEVRAQTGPVDFHDAPARYLTITGFVDDWLKTLVSERGSLAYDFGPGPYAQPLTEVTVGLEGVEMPEVQQSLADPVVPVVRTALSAGGTSLTLRSFSVVTGNDGSSPSGRVGRVRRLGGLTGTGVWAAPPRGTDPAFRSVAWGTNRPIIYRVAVPRGSRRQVMVGLCEAYKPRPAMRLVELRVEGAPTITVDPMKDSVRNRPYVYLFQAADADRDGFLSIEAHASPRSPDPNVILNCFWIFGEDVPITERAVLRGDLSSQAEVYYACGQELERSAFSPRLDAILAQIERGPGTPVVTIRSRRALRYDPAAGMVRAEERPFLLTRPAPVGAAKTPEGLQLTFLSGTRQVEVIAAHGPADVRELQKVPALGQALIQSAAHWKSMARIRYDAITVPDSGLQFLLRTSLRTLYQVRERVDGALQYQPGPTVYRGLWGGDVMLTGMPLLMAGDRRSVREFLEAVLQRQLPDGRVRTIEPVFTIPETPAAVAALCLFARATNDLEWIRGKWDAVVRGLSWVAAIRTRTLADPPAPWYGLMPPGFVDGGIAGETADYGSVWWSMIGLEQGLAMALRLGIAPDPRWRSTYDGLAEHFRAASRRDMRRDARGNPYLPIAVNDTSATAPTRGQYALLFPFRWGSFFLSDSAFLRPALSTLAMLDAWQAEGLVVNSGWLQGGVWPWLGGIQGMAHALLGNSARARELLYAVANHASPTGVWVEEQQAKKFGRGTSGDVSDAEASAVFIAQVRDLLAQERGDTLDLLRALPPHWIRPGAVIALNESGTLFGPLTFRLSVSPDGRQAELDLTPIDGNGAGGGPLVHLDALSLAGFVSENGEQLPATLRGTWGSPLRLSVHRQ